MSDFMDRFGRQLAEAGHAFAPSGGRLGATSAPLPWWRRPWGRKTALLLAAVVVAGPALAATEPWRPLLGRPALHDTPTISTTSVPADQLALLGVLRKPQTSTDRSPTTEALLHNLGVEQRGVRLDSIRLLDDRHGEQAVLVSVQSVGSPDASTDDETTNALCLLVPGGGMCGTVASLKSGYFLLDMGPRQLGLVPDGVSRVLLTYPEGETRTVTVTDNFFAVSDAPVVSASGAGGPPARGAKPRVQWLNGDGQPVGPAPTN